MAKNTENVLIKGLSGTVGKLITFRQRAGKTIVGKSRRKNAGPLSDKALAVQARFKSSLGYAKIAVKDPAIKQLYEAVTGADQSAFNLAFRDAFLVPKVESIDASNYRGAAGERITIRATDDFKVISVMVSILDTLGNLIEAGDASVEPNGADWVYHSTQKLPAITGSKISALAKDLPGNNGTLEIIL
jgi:hypothetical protein